MLSAGRRCSQVAAEEPVVACSCGGKVYAPERPDGTCRARQMGLAPHRMRHGYAPAGGVPAAGYSGGASIRLASGVAFDSTGMRLFLPANRRVRVRGAVEA